MALHLISASLSDQCPEGLVEHPSSQYCQGNAHGEWICFLNSKKLRTIILVRVNKTEDHFSVQLLYTHGILRYTNGTGV